MMNSEKIKKIKQMSKQISILYVEDDLAVSEQLGIFLKKFFHNIDFAYDGEEGLALYREKEHDLVITDIKMPKMNGIEMIGEIKKIDEEQIIIVTSAYDDSDYLMQLIGLGVSNFLLKPFDTNKMFVLLARFVVSIYKEKKYESMEDALDEKLKLNQLLVDKMITPVIIFENDTVTFVNEKFKSIFLSKSAVDDISKIELGSIFNNKTLSKLSNKSLINHLEKDNASENIIKTINENKLERFVVNVTSVEEISTKLICFFNIESIRKELDEFRVEQKIDTITSLPTKEVFKTELEQILNTGIEYDVFCFGLKNLKEFTRSFGLNALDSVYAEMSKNLKFDFHNQITDNEMEIFYFKDNRFVALVTQEGAESTKRSLGHFGDKYSFTEHGSKFSPKMHLDVLSLTISPKLSLEQNIKDVENKLYMLKGNL